MDWCCFPFHSEDILSCFICCIFWVHLFHLCRYNAYESIALLWNRALEWAGDNCISVFSIHTESIAECVSVCTCVLLSLLCVYWSFLWCPGMLIIVFSPLHVSVGINRCTHIAVCGCFWMGVSQRQECESARNRCDQWKQKTSLFFLRIRNSFILPYFKKVCTYEEFVLASWCITINI